MELPRLLFPSNPIEPGKPDFDFELEHEAARAAGFEVGILDTDRAELVRAYPSGQVLYRGWMVSADRYAWLCEALRNEGHEPVTSAESYRFCHHLPGWYTHLASHTPASVWYPGAEDWSADSVVAALGEGPFIVKDYVKSAKHNWHEACYIPDAETLPRVAARFLELRGEDLEGGLVFRRFVPFAAIGEHPKSGMPMTLEFRAFVCRGRRIGEHRYWEAGDYPDAEPPWEELCSGLGPVKSEFFAVDVARDEDGRWWIVEIGDGQVSGLPPGLSPFAFYGQLAEALAS